MSDEHFRQKRVNVTGRILSEISAKLTRKTPEPGRAFWVAVCPSVQHPDDDIWAGAKRSDRREAVRDAIEHEKQYSRHNPFIFSPNREDNMGDDHYSDKIVSVTGEDISGINRKLASATAPDSEDMFWVAVCYSTDHEGGGTWTGAKRSDQKQAVRDAVEHEELYTSHDAIVIETT